MAHSFLNTIFQTPAVVGHKGVTHYAIALKLPSGNYVEIRTKEKLTDEDLLDIIEVVQGTIDEDESTPRN